MEHHGRTMTLVVSVRQGRSWRNCTGSGRLERLGGDVVRREAIDRALASLPHDLRTVVTLRDIQGLKYDEIAGITGVPIGTVDSMLFPGTAAAAPATRTSQCRALRHPEHGGGSGTLPTRC
jgi:hypothetical protein